MPAADRARGGLALGFSLGLNRPAARWASRSWSSLYTIPKITLYPRHPAGVRARHLRQGRVRHLAWIIPVAIFAIGVRNVAAVQIKTARVLRLSRRQTLRPS